MKINRAVIDALFKRVPSPSFHRFRKSARSTEQHIQPIAKIKKLSTENRQAIFKQEQFIQRVLRVSAATPKYPIRTAVHSTPPTAINSMSRSRTEPPYMSSRRTTLTAPTFSVLCFPALEPKRRGVEHNFDMMRSQHNGLIPWRQRSARHHPSRGGRTTSRVDLSCLRAAVGDLCCRALDGRNVY